MPKFALIFFGFISFASGAKVYQVDGIVVAVDAAQQTITVSHRPIAKLMPAMTMPFRVENPKELNALHPGSRVHFDLAIQEGRSSARNIRITGGSDLDIPVPKSRAAIGSMVPDFTLTDQSSQQVRLSDFNGKVVAVDFIYTRCPLPDVCPRLSANFAFLQRRFGNRDLVLLSITVDPQFDTPEVLHEYAKRWAAEPQTWHFLTGSATDVQHVAGTFGLVYWPDEGSIGHNSTTSILGRDGHLVAIVEGSSFRADQLADLVARQLEVSQ